MKYITDLTFFTTCKPFVGEAAIMQKNALKSWSELGIPTIVFGSDKGSQEIARELNFDYYPEVECSESGIPLVSDMFTKAQKLCITPYLCIS